MYIREERMCLNAPTVSRAISLNGSLRTEGDIWVATLDGLDRFRDLAVPTISVKQGLSNATVESVLAARDGSVARRPRVVCPRRFRVESWALARPVAAR
jgi:hypothetical protein